MIGLAGFGAKALPFMAKHWGKILAAVLLSIWMFVTWWLYDENMELNQANGQFQGAIAVCESDRQILITEVSIINETIDEIQAENEKYRQDIEDANEVISDLDEEIEDTLEELEKEKIPASCEGTMNWMREQAVKK